jgi:hypothetical protein
LKRVADDVRRLWKKFPDPSAGNWYLETGNSL